MIHKKAIEDDSKILVYGAGAIGSIFAGKLKKAGYNITLLARGKRYEEICSKGLILKNAITGRMEVYDVHCIKELEPTDTYDYIIVVVQNHQIDDILPILSENNSKNIVFVVNNPLGYDKYIKAVGKERVMIGFPSAGGERKNGVVTYFIGTGMARIMQTTTFGELDGSNSERLKLLINIFERAGFQPVKSSDMDSWQKTHIALVIPIALALHKFQSDNYLLSKSQKTIKQMILATREGFKALKENNIVITPIKLNFYYLPIWLLVMVYQILFKTRIAEYSMAKHTKAAMEEIRILEEQFFRLYKENDFKNWNALKNI